MKMFMDVSNLDQSDLTGIGVYTKHLFGGLKKISESSLFPICSASRWHKKSIIERHINSKVTSSLIVPQLPFGLKLLHSPDHREMTTAAHLRVQTIHDLAMMEDYDFSDPRFRQKFRRRFDSILNNPKINRFIAVSNFTKERILFFYPHLKGKIDVIHSGSDHFQPTSGQSPLFPWPYVLFAGTLEARKNLIVLLKAFEYCAPKFTNLRLVLIGKEGYRSDEILRAIDKHPFKDRIVWKNYVTKTILSNAYQFAEMFVFPSKYDGFGLPILEAMRHRCPVICSAIPSLTEIGGDAVRTFIPEDSIGLAEAIEKVFVNPSERYMLKSLGSKNVLKYEWETASKQTWNIYMNLLRERLQEGIPSEHWESALIDGKW